jgi:hypothetical protein
MKALKHHLKHFVKNAPIALGIILIWRGVWVALDTLDQLFFGGDHGISAAIGIIVGFVLLYYSEEGLQSLERL